MTEILCDITMSLDGFVAGPNPSLEAPLGIGGDRLHEWAYPLGAWRRQHGLEGGETNASSAIVEETLERTAVTIMGRRMFSGGQGPWEEDGNARGWWGDEPPFHHPVFVVTHHERDPLEMDGGTTFGFVTGGINDAVDRARAVAEGGDIVIAGGASVIQQGIKAGLVQGLSVHLVPLFLGSGTRLFEDLEPRKTRLEIARVVAAPAVTHLLYDVHDDR